MPTRRTQLSPHSPFGQLAKALAELRETNGITEEFPAEVESEAAGASATSPISDLRAVAFVTLDPLGSRDLDQAFHLERTESGWLLRYAIADVPGFVVPGGAIDAEARRRGQTLYLPDGSVPLHPRELSEDRASLLPHADRTAYVWSIPTDHTARAAFEGGVAAPARVERALVRSRAQLDYVSAQRDLDAGRASGSLALLREFGEARIERESERGGANLGSVDEEVVRDEHGYRIERRVPPPVEEWNAQLSLLTGMTAGRIMLDGGIGVLRTMAAPDEAALEAFRARVAALGLPWSASQSYGDYLRELPRETPAAASVLRAAASLFRGAGYEAFGVQQDGKLLLPPPNPEQAAIAAPYAHVTAPLRRLVDRWGLVICEALSAGTTVPDWVHDSLAEIPDRMRASASLAGRLGAEALDRIEAALLRDRAGDVLDAVVLEGKSNGAVVQITDPPITARCADPEGVLTPGTHARVRVLGAQVASGSIDLEPVVNG